jgi:signal transduction histidine kinase
MIIRIALFLTLTFFYLVSFSQTDSLFQQAKALAEDYAYNQSNPFFERLISESLSPLQTGQAHFYLMRGLWSDNQFDKSLAHGDSALTFFVSINDHNWIGETLYRLCMNNLIAGSYDVALIQSQQALDEFTLAKDTAMMIRAKGRRGIVFHDIGEYDEGIRTLEEAYELFQNYTGKNKDILAMIYGITAINYDDRGDSDIAVEYYKKILAFQDELSTKREVIRTYNNMGNSLMKLGQLNEARKYFLLNLKANEEANFAYGIATVKTNLGTVAYKQGDFATAKTYLNEAEAISYEIRDAEKILDILQQQHFYHERIGEPTTSLEYLKKYHHLKDSLYDLDKQRQIALLEKKYETAKKEQQIEVQAAEIAEKSAENQRNVAMIVGLIIGLVLLGGVLLLNRNRLLKKQRLLLQEAQIQLKEAQIEAAISSQEKERSRFAKDLHDGFGQMISILNLNLKSLEDDGKDKHEVFENSSKVLEEMYQELKGICFNLMPQTLIKHGITAALNEFAARINTTDKLHVETDFFGLEDRLTEVQEISLYRISQEWVNNVMKYSDATKVTIQITRDEEEMTLMIEDDGTGFDLDQLKSGKGNGWKNMTSRANLINGELEIDSTLGIKGNTLIVNATSITSEKQSMIISN